MLNNNGHKIDKQSLHLTATLRVIFTFSNINAIGYFSSVRDGTGLAESLTIQIRMRVGMRM